MTYPIRVVPWWTPGANKFISNLCKWYPQTLSRRLTAFEVGSGNSTLFLLNKNFSVVSVECDSGYVEHVTGLAIATGYKVKVVHSYADIDPAYDLNMIQLSEYTNAIKPGTWYAELGIDGVSLDYDLLINDGVDRMLFMRKFSLCEQAIVLVDNCEYAANWGRIAKSSAKPDLISEYRRFFRSTLWNNILFEQTEGRDGMGIPDATGWESNHRWITGISWGQEHVLSKLMVTNLGFPLVNMAGENDLDLDSLEQRCGFNWETMQWDTNEEFPESLNLGLDRNHS